MSQAPPKIFAASDTPTSIITRSSRSFSIASSFLPAAVRADVLALYAWCRSVDDAVDRATSHSEAARALEQFEADLIRCQRGDTLQQPASQWIQPLIVARRIEVRHARELIEGMRMDLEGFSVETEADLLRYCYHAAGTVGLMMTSLMGVTDRAADRHAIALGIAMQLTNIARDVREDADRGRSYLPSIPRVFDVAPGQVQAAVADLLELAEDRYGVALEGLHYLPRRCRCSIRIALEVYREIGREIQRRGYRVLEGRTVISKCRLIWVATRASLASLSTDTMMIFRSGIRRIAESCKEWTMKKPVSTPQSLQPSTVSQAKQTAFLGLSLTAIMATALFVMVYMNPKSTEYSSLPLVYAGASLVASILFHRLSARCATSATVR